MMQAEIVPVRDGPVASQPLSVTLPGKDATGVPDVRKLSEAAALLTSIIAAGEATHWAIGEAVSIFEQKNAPASETPEAQRKRLRAMCQGLADETGVGANTLVEKYDTVLFYPALTREKYATLTYSVFREIRRASATLDDARPWLEQANIHGYKAHQVRAAMRGNGSETKREKRVYDVTPVGYDFGDTADVARINLEVPIADYFDFKSLRDKPGFRCELRVSWDETRERETA